MGTNVNLIKTLTKTVNECKNTAKTSYEKIFQLSKESPLRKMGFNEIEEYHGSPGVWSLKGENSHLEFCEGERACSINLFNTGSRIDLTEDSRTVWYGSGNEATSDGLLSGVTRTKDKITFHHIEGRQKDITVPITTSKSKIQEILFKLLGKQLPKQKWSMQELDKRIVEDFSEEMIKPVHDFLEGNLNKEKLVELIKKYRKNISEPVIYKNETLLEHLETTIPANYVPKEILDNLKIDKIMRKDDLYLIYYIAGDTCCFWDLERAKKAQALLEEFKKALNISPNKKFAIYRWIGKEELDKILAGKTVKPQLLSNSFDVTTVHNRFKEYNDNYRVKFNVNVDEQTINKTIFVHGNVEDDFYHWRVPEYTIKDVRSIVNTKNNSLIYESDEEILSNFIDGYISKLG